VHATLANEDPLSTIPPVATIHPFRAASANEK
jgi:hypothetical protein